MFAFVQKLGNQPGVKSLNKKEILSIWIPALKYGTVHFQVFSSNIESGMSNTFFFFFNNCISVKEISSRISDVPYPGPWWQIPCLFSTLHLWVINKLVSILKKKKKK